MPGYEYSNVGKSNHRNTAECSQGNGNIDTWPNTKSAYVRISGQWSNVVSQKNIDFLSLKL